MIYCTERKAQRRRCDSKIDGMTQTSLLFSHSALIPSKTREENRQRFIQFVFFFFWKSDLKRYFFSTLCCCPRLFSAVASSLLSSCYKVCGYLQKFMITFLTTFTQKTETIRTNRFFVTYQRMYLSRFLSPFRAFKSVSLKLKPKKEKKNESLDHSFGSAFLPCSTV